MSTVEPAAPTLVSVEGNGTLGSNQNGPVFRFHAPSRNPTTNVTVHPASTRVRVSVPYPSSIELAINGKPLAKVDPPLLTTNYVYAGAIDNPGQNPATWTTAIKTPFDIPYYTQSGGEISYSLTIFTVTGSARSKPLTIYYSQPVWIQPQVYSARTVHTSDTPSATAAGKGPCTGGAAEQSFRICFRNPPQQPNDITVQACSYSQAVSSLTHAYGASHSQGAC